MQKWQPLNSMGGKKSGTSLSVVSFSVVSAVPPFDISKVTATRARVSSHRQMWSKANFSRTFLWVLPYTGPRFFMWFTALSIQIRYALFSKITSRRSRPFIFFYPKVFLAAGWDMICFLKRTTRKDSPRETLRKVFRLD